jgi:hypothetical protein
VERYAESYTVTGLFERLVYAWPSCTFGVLEQLDN